MGLAAGAPRPDALPLPAKSIVRAFEAVGCTRAVALTEEDEGLLLQVIEAWGDEEVDYSKPPPGIFDLRNALAEESDLREEGRSGH